jgi:hypothetical protein
MKKGDRKGSSDFDGSTDRIFKEAREEHERENVSFSSLRDLRALRGEVKIPPRISGRNAFKVAMKIEVGHNCRGVLILQRK